MFALLCCLASFASSREFTSAHRTPGTLFAAMEIPMPLPQQTMPSAALPSATALPQAYPYSG